MTVRKGSRSQWLRCNRSCPGSNGMGVWSFQLLRRSCCTMRTPRLGLAECSSSLISSEVFQRKSKKLPKKLLKCSKASVKTVRALHATPADDSLYSRTSPVTDPSGVRFSVTGNILGVSKPRSTWSKYFGSALPVSRAALNKDNPLLNQFGGFRMLRYPLFPWHPIR